MKRIVIFLIGIFLMNAGFCGSMDVFALDAEEMLKTIDVCLTLDGITTQAELMQSTVIEGKVVVTDTTTQTEQTELVVSAFRNGEVQHTEVLHSGMLPAGVTYYDFRMDNLKKADHVQAYLVRKETGEVCCPVAEDMLEPAQVVVIKFDDSRPVMGMQIERIDTALDDLRAQDIQGTVGILGKWLESAKENPKKYQYQVNTIKSWIADGHQLWIHGYDHSPGEFAARKEIAASSYEKQKEIIAGTMELMSTVLHYRATCFGASFHQNNEDTISVINQEFPEIQTVLFMYDTNNRLCPMNFSTENICEIETPSGAVSSQMFLLRYQFLKEKPYFVIQAHPGQWDENSFSEMKTIIAFLKSENCVFMTPEQYNAYLSGNNR